MKKIYGGQEELAYACFQPIAATGGSPMRKTGAELETVESNMVDCIKAPVWSENSQSRWVFVTFLPSHAMEE